MEPTRVAACFDNRLPPDISPRSTQSNLAPSPFNTRPERAQPSLLLALDSLEGLAVYPAMEQRDVQRKLAAILHADVAGYSRLMGEDEESTVRLLQEYRAVASEQIRNHRGRVLDMSGDSVLAEFSSAGEALQCAVELQDELRRRNTRLPEERRVHFRVGINLGDVIVDGTAIYGDGVNIAARLESLAEPGGICISGTVYDSVGKRLPLDFEFLGERSVKNIASPVRTYRVRAGGAGADRVTRPPRARGSRRRYAFMLLGVTAIVAVALAMVFSSLERSPAEAPGVDTTMPQSMQTERPVIAVLPFDNLGDDPEQEYFADGITDDIITNLTKIAGLVVISRDSTFNYKGAPVDPRELGQALGTDYILEGSVRRSDRQLRINVQLIDAGTGGNLWAERYDAPLDDIFALQDEIATKVSALLAVKLTQYERETLGSGQTSNLEAYDHFLHGRSRFFLYAGREENDKARGFYQKALEIDPEYARADAMLAWSYWFDFVNGWSEDPRRTLDRALSLANEATSLDDALPVAHFVRGLIHREKGEYDQALTEAKRAIAIDPSYANAFVLLATVYYYTGDAEKGLEQMEKAIRLNPHHPHNYPFHLGQAYFVLHRYDEAIAAFRRGLAQHPNSERLRIWLAAAYAQAGKIGEAEWQAEQLLIDDPEFTVGRIERVFPFSDPKDLEHFLDGLRKAGLSD
jgi:adenylate cyclase